MKPALPDVRQWLPRYVQYICLILSDNAAYTYCSAPMYSLIFLDLPFISFWNPVSIPMEREGIAEVCFKAFK